MKPSHSTLIEFLAGFPEIPEEQIPEIAANIPISAYKKGTILQKEGEVPQECYFVLHGIVREYKWVDGEEKTVEFYTEKNGTISSSHFMKQIPYDANLQCVEDCLLIVGSMDIEEANLEKFPVLKEIMANMIEADLYETKEKFSRYVMASPKERYLDLMEKQPELVQRVPLHQIASYLGMTPESLSRIRKRISLGNG